MKIDKNMRWVIAGVFLISILCALLALQDLVRVYILMPLYYFGWVLNLLIKSLHQSVFWVMLIILGFLFAVRSLAVFEQLPERQEIMHTRERSSRFRFWWHNVRMLRSSSHSFSYSSFEMRRLIIGILAYQENITPNEVESLISKGNLQVPPEVARFITKRSMGKSDKNENAFERKLNDIRHFFSGRDNPVDPSLDRDMNIVIQFAESLLEVKRDSDTL